MTVDVRRTPLVAGNWKMHKTVGEAVALIEDLRGRLDGAEGAEVVVCPPFTALYAAKQALEGSGIALGAQDAHWEKQGAFTGAISVPMLVDVGCRYVIIGHSERRQHFGETDQTVARKVRAVLGAGLVPIVCVGESWEQREAGQTEEWVRGQVLAALDGLDADQIAGLAVAYEPVWAIGTGRAATRSDAGEVAGLIRDTVARMTAPAAAARMRILYGGSVTPDNMAGFMEEPEVDGALVGGASLKADGFAAIVQAALAVKA